MTYAIISLGGKQYRVQQGQRLLVDRLGHEDGKTFHPEVLFLGGDGKAEFAPKGQQVTAKVVGSALGDKIHIGKYKRRTGYRRHTGHRAKLTQIEITAVGATARAARPKAETDAKAPPKPKAEPAPRADGAEKPTPAAAEKPKRVAAAKTKAPAKPRAAAKPKAAAKPRPQTKPKEEDQ
jgi:large subunit ribosomal protein L21